MNISYIKKIINENNLVTKNIIKYCAKDIKDSINILIEGISNNKKILWCGNGGSAADAQHMDCRDGGTAEEAVTHTSRAPKPAVELSARIPMSRIAHADTDAGEARGVLLQVIAMPEFSAWFKFRQRLVRVPDTDPPRLELTEAVAVSAAEDSEDADRDGLIRDTVHEL